MLIIYLGYDDILRLISSYWILPVIILMTIYGMLYAIGLESIPKRIIYTIQDVFVKKVQGLFLR